MDGDIYGYQGNYLTMAMNAFEKHSFTVIVSTTVQGFLEQASIDDEVIENYCQSRFSDYEFLYFGFSYGGLIGLWNLDNMRTKRKLICNAPLMININYTFHGIMDSQGEKTLSNIWNVRSILSYF